jgi:hypothetical protein
VTRAERKAILERFGTSPGRVASAAVAAQARRLGGEGGQGRPEGWSEREVVAHLVRVEREVFRVRLRELAREDEPRWQWVEPGADPGHVSLATLVDRFATSRATTIRYLTGLDDAGWARTGIHATFGRLDVAGLLGIAIDHDADHLAELERRAG